MTLPALDQIEHLAHTELVALVKALIAENVALRAELDRLRQPPPTSRNSAQPPSRDAKRDLPADRKRKKLGPPFGHARKMRPLVDQPDRIIEATVEWCAHCQADLRGVEPRAVVRHQLTELPPVKPVVLETRQHEVVCPDCQGITRGELPEGLEAGRSFGPRLAATVVYLKHEQHLS
jgi:transposase